MFKQVFGLLSPGGARARLSVLIFHRVLEAPDPLFPDELDRARFTQICGWLRQWFNVIALDEAAQRLKTDSLPARALAITFDDGYADNHDQALPVLQQHGLTATFFIATGYLDGGRMWNDSIIEAVRAAAAPGLDLQCAELPAACRRVWPIHDARARRTTIDALIGPIKYLPDAQRADAVAAIVERAGAALPDQLMMSSAQLRGLAAAGMQIGAHTVSHPILARLDGPDARREMADSKHRLEALLGRPVPLFAYPNGKPGQDFTPESVRIAAEIGFESAVTTAAGAADRRSDHLQLPRFTPWDRSRTRFGARLAANLAQPRSQASSR